MFVRLYAFSFNQQIGEKFQSIFLGIGNPQNVKRFNANIKFIPETLFNNFVLTFKIYNKIRTSSVWWRIGFLCIFIEAFDRLLQVRLGYVRVNDQPAGTRNRRKATVKMRRNPIRHQTNEIQKLWTNNSLGDRKCNTNQAQLRYFEHTLTLLLYV